MNLFPTPLELALRLAVAAVLGGVLGLEREWHRKPAGLRTHMMVALGAATFSVIGLEWYATVAPAASGAARVDPLRIVAAIASGIGFLGAGSIIQARGTVSGLTTAGSLWLAGAVGMAAGSGLYRIAAVAVGIALVVLAIVGRLEARFEHDRAGDS